MTLPTPRPGAGVYETDTRPDGTTVTVQRRPDGSWREVVQQATTGEVFDLRTPYLLQGRTTDVRSRSKLMRLGASDSSEYSDSPFDDTMPAP